MRRKDESMITKYINGKIYMEQGRFVEAMSVEDEKIIAVGTNDEIKSSKGDTIVDLEGKTVIPGINDSHLHLYITGNALAQLQLNGARSIDEIVERGKKYIEENPDLSFVVGRGWNQDYFEEGEKRSVNRHDLDRISTEVPIVAERVCVHVISMNTKALELLGWDKDKVIPGGEIYREEDGEMLGVFTENAAIEARSIVPQDSEEEIEKKFLLAADYALKNGVTTVQSCDIMMADHWNPMFSVIQKIYKEKKTPMRYFPQFNFNQMDTLKEYIEKYYYQDIYDDVYQKGAIKLFKDGSLGARTALLSKPYYDDPSTKGVESISKEDMDAFCAFAEEKRIPLLVHTIGDEAIRTVVDSYEKHFKDGKNSLRHTLVHCQITDKPLMKRIGDLDIVVSYQPIFLEYDITMMEDRVGPELASTSYAYHSMKNIYGAHTAYSTDSPVEDLNPFPCIFSAVTRQRTNGFPEDGFYPEERVSVEDAIDSYTLESAYMEGVEDRKGRLKPGYYADFIVLDRDIFTCDPMEIKDITVEKTFVNGALAYEK